MNKQSAVQKMEEYMHLVKLMNNVDEALDKINPVYSTVNTPTKEVWKAKDNNC